MAASTVGQDEDWETVRKYLGKYSTRDIDNDGAAFLHPF